MPLIEVPPVIPPLPPRRETPANGTRSNGKYKPAQSPLSGPDAEDLAIAEQIIRDREQSYEKVGQALARIKDRKLYRVSHDSFEKYCQQKWQISRGHAYRLIDAALLLCQLRSDPELVKLSPSGDVPVPMNECLARKLLTIPEKHRCTAWKSALELAAGKPVTGRILGTAVRPYLREKPRTKPTLRAWVATALADLEKAVCEHMDHGELLKAIQNLKARIPGTGASFNSAKP